MANEKYFNLSYRGEDINDFFSQLDTIKNNPSAEGTKWWLRDFIETHSAAKENINELIVADFKLIPTVLNYEYVLSDQKKETYKTLDLDSAVFGVQTNSGYQFRWNANNQVLFDTASLAPSGLFNSIKSLIFSAIYPIGSVYVSFSETNPHDLFGGTWERIQGKFLLSNTDGTEQQELIDLKYSRSHNGYHYWVDKDGYRHSITPNSENYSAISGEAMHTLSGDEMPSHTHHLGLVRGDETGYVPANGTVGGVQIVNNTQGPGNTSGVFADRPPNDYVSDRANMTAEGNSYPHNNMPPYVAVYMWKRVS